MIRNFFKIAFRNLKKNKVFSIINILGLAVGISFQAIKSAIANPVTSLRSE